MALPLSQTHTFIVRLWFEPDEASTGEWRGSLDFVQSGEHYYFRSLEGLTETVTRLIDQPEATATPDPTKVPKSPSDDIRGNQTDRSIH